MEDGRPEWAGLLIPELSLILEVIVKAMLPIRSRKVRSEGEVDEGGTVMLKES